MRTKRTFKPAANETLEDRSVPSAGGGLSSLAASIPAQDAWKVSQAFATFDQTYKQDVATILLAPGTTNPTANRANFDAAVSTALGNLNATIGTAISNLPTAASLGTEIQSELLGGGRSLQNELASIPTPKVAAFRGYRAIEGPADRFILGAGAHITRQVATAPVVSNAIPLTTLKADLKAIHNAFQTFNHTYNSNVHTILLAPGTTTPANNRPAFDAAVGTALNTLKATISSALSNLPSSVASSLTTTVQKDLLAGAQTAGLDLQSRLAGLASPTSVTGPTEWLFKVGSTLNSSLAEREMVGQVTAAVATYNAGL